MSRQPQPSWFFSLVIVRKENQFLVVQERKHDQQWYLPAGRLETGETFAQAARRETLEESGLKVQLQGILRIEQTAKRSGCRIRVIFVAVPLDDCAPKQTADRHSLQAKWVTLDELKTLPLRSNEVPRLFQEVFDGASIHPLSVLPERI